MSSRVSSSDTAEQFQEIDPLGGASDNLVVQVNRGNFQSSPMRGKNYDVCKKAATYIAVRQVLPRLEESRVPDKRAQGAWLRSLWDTEYCALFESDSGRFASENFLAALVRKPSAVMPLDGRLYSTEPKDVARQIMDARREVLDEWREYLESGKVESGHTEIMRELLMKSIDKE